MKIFITLFTLILLSLFSCAMPEDTMQGPGNGSLSSPYQINTAEELNAVRGGVTGYEEWDLTDSYILMADIDLSGFGDWESLGSVTVGFSGTFYGNDKTISSLNINSDTSTAGLFGSIAEGGEVQSLSVTDASVIGKANTGVLAGSNYGSITGCRSTGSVESTAGGYVGGLIGLNAGTVSESSSSAAVLSSNEADGQYAGGFAGFNSGTIEQCYSTGDVEGLDNNVGGFVGSFSGSVNDSFSTGNVIGSVDLVGGFSGNNQGGYLTDCYSSGQVSIDPVSRVAVTSIKGFVGQGVEASRNISCYYNSTIAGYADDFAVDIDLTNQASFSGFDFSSIWSIDSSVNGGMPHLTELGF